MAPQVSGQNQDLWSAGKLRWKGLVEVRNCTKNHENNLGLFALRDLTVGETIAQFENVTLLHSDPNTGYSRRVGENKYMTEFPPKSKFFWSNFIHYSEHPNTKFIIRTLGTNTLAASLFSGTRVLYVVMEPIRKGEELFVNYNETLV